MMRFTCVLVLLAVASQCSYGQPTHDDSVLYDFIQWRDGHELLERMMTYLQRVVVHQEQQQRAQDERLERLERTLNGSIEGQRRLEMQVSQLQQQLGAVNQTCVTSTEQFLEEHNDISTQPVATQGMLTRVVNFPKI